MMIKIRKSSYVILQNNTRGKYTMKFMFFDMGVYLFSICSPRNVPQNIQDKKKCMTVWQDSLHGLH